jgi:hypothetical protein
MLGELIAENRGKRIVRRALSSDPVKVEVSFEDGGKVLGIDANGFGSYTSVVRPDGRRNDLVYWIRARDD